MIGAHTSEYKAYTYIDIKAPAEKIWSNVTRVREISEEEDQGYLTHLLNFPRPVKAELNYEGVGAYRAAIFTNGLVFHETVTEYIPLKKCHLPSKRFLTKFRLLQWMNIWWLEENILMCSMALMN
jgi:hypothetical protein